MATINISIPTRLRSQAEELIASGYYISFSDLVRDSLRRLVEKNKFDLWTEEAKKDFKRGKAVVLNSGKEINKYLKGLEKPPTKNKNH